MNTMQLSLCVLQIYTQNFGMRLVFTKVIRDFLKDFEGTIFQNHCRQLWNKIVFKI